MTVDIIIIFAGLVLSVACLQCSAAASVLISQLSVRRDVILHLPLALLMLVRLAVEKSLQRRRVRAGLTGRQGVLGYLHRQGWSLYPEWNIYSECRGSSAPPLQGRRSLANPGPGPDILRLWKYPCWLGVIREITIGANLLPFSRHMCLWQ